MSRNRSTAGRHRIRAVTGHLTTFLCSILCAAWVAAGQEPLSLGVHPYLPATELVRNFSPLASYLGMRLGREVTVKISSDYREHIDRVGNDRFDIAFLGPASYVDLVDSFGKKPILARLVVRDAPEFKGVIFTREESPIRKLEELQGRRFAFGDPVSTMSHLVPRYVMWKSGVEVEALAHYQYLGSHHNVALGVLVGDFDAGAVKEEVFERYKERGLRKLAVTPSISEHLFVTSATLPSKTVDRLRRAFSELMQYSGGERVIRAIKSTATGMTTAEDSDYANLRCILHTLRDQGVEF